VHRHYFREPIVILFYIFLVVKEIFHVSQIYFGNRIYKRLRRIFTNRNLMIEPLPLTKIHN
jgi:hypothetical protein